MPNLYFLHLPPPFYTTMQRRDFPFPHEDGDTLSAESLRTYWWDGSVFRTYCADRNAWDSWRNSETVQEFVEVYLRCKCLLEHMDIEDTEFYAAIDRVTTITQILLYEVLQQKREEDSEICRKWGSALVSLKRIWIGMPYSMLKRFGTHQVRKEAIKTAFAPLLEIEGTVRLI